MSLHWESFNRPSDFTIDSISVIGIYQGPGSGRGMRNFKLMQQAQCFLGAYAAVYNSFNLGGIWCQQKTIDILDHVPLRLGIVRGHCRKA